MENDDMDKRELEQMVIDLHAAIAVNNSRLTSGDKAFDDARRALEKAGQDFQAALGRLPCSLHAQQLDELKKKIFWASGWASCAGTVIGAAISIIVAWLGK